MSPHDLTVWLILRHIHAPETTQSLLPCSSTWGISSPSLLRPLTHALSNIELIHSIYYRYHPNVEGYTTWWVLRLVYQILELMTLYQVYWWNHDDESNLYCHPNEHISFSQLIKYRKTSPAAANFVFSTLQNPIRKGIGKEKEGNGGAAWFRGKNYILQYKGYGTEFCPTVRFQQFLRVIVIVLE